MICLASVGLILPGRESNTLLDLVACGSAQRAGEILATWPSAHRVAVAYAVGLDFLMNPAYMTTIGIATIWAGRQFTAPPAGRIAAGLAWLAWSVVVTNIVENVGLFVALTAGPADPWPLMVATAHYWAGIVVVLCIVFLVAGGLARAKSAA